MYKYDKGMHGMLCLGSLAIHQVALIITVFVFRAVLFISVHGVVVDMLLVHRAGALG